MLCPHCKDINLAMTDRQGIEIDYCPTCRGIWLDRGELDRLIERAEAAERSERGSAPPPMAPPPHREAPQYRESSYPKEHYKERGYHDDRYAHGQRKKPKSLLGELFDF